MTATVFERQRAQLMAYVPWMLRDYLTNQGPATAIVMLLIGVVTVGPALSMARVRGLSGIDAEMARALLTSLTEALAFLGAFFATNGIIANDRKFAYYRFLFAKPLHPPTYYAVTFAVYLAGLLVVTLVLTLAWSVIVRPMFLIRMVYVVALIYLAYGGIGFLLSAAWRFDWLSLVSVIFAANIGWQLWGDSDSALRWVLYLLPPVHLDDQVYALIRHPDRAVPWRAVGWLGGYGLACFLLGMVVVRKRPLGTS